ncbi:MAG: hypothetical protein H7Y01_12665, partial [Ferruginibacter sp.]|nr:hypothetical protein [Chitinophagaceae bacterium]
MEKDNYISLSGKEILSPAIVRISFTPVFESLRKLTRDEDRSVAAYATTLLEDLKEYPILEEGFSDHSILKTHEKPIAKLLRILFPEALATNEIKGITAPFEFE